MQIRIGGVYSKDYRAADGSLRRYHCHRATGARLPDDPTSPDFLLRVRELERKPRGPRVAKWTLGDLVQRFRGSPRYAKLRETTHKEYWTCHGL
ncbi:MAG: hypothetical protein JSR87_15295, partial [Proteobacteria bacterium]|nr:hypothetical protein [Pseudomonadota bacterium]